MLEQHPRVELQNKEHDIFYSRFHLSKKLPKDILITSAFTFPIKGNSILLILDKKDFWNPPGGHVEKNESIEECIKRETLEEGGVEIKDIKPLGYLEIEITKNKSHRYPQRTIMPITYSQITKVDETWKAIEAKERRFVTYDEGLKLFKERDDQKQMFLIFSELKGLIQ
ncbi:MAG: NUDIX domain-containing protein [Candidatus Dojkabacteria bacterium]